MRITLLVAIYLMFNHLGQAANPIVRTRPGGIVQLSNCGGFVEITVTRQGLTLEFEDVESCDMLAIMSSKNSLIKEWSFRRGGNQAPFSPKYFLGRDSFTRGKKSPLILVVQGWQSRDVIFVTEEQFPCSGCLKPNQNNFTGWSYMPDTLSCGFYRSGRFQRWAGQDERWKCQRQ